MESVEILYEQYYCVSRGQVSSISSLGSEPTVDVYVGM